jgi:hypothetical protein
MLSAPRTVLPTLVWLEPMIGEKWAAVSNVQERQHLALGEGVAERLGRTMSFAFFE